MPANMFWTFFYIELNGLVSMCAICRIINMLLADTSQLRSKFRLITSFNSPQIISINGLVVSIFELLLEIIEIYVLEYQLNCQMSKNQMFDRLIRVFHEFVSFTSLHGLIHIAKNFGFLNKISERYKLSKRWNIFIHLMFRIPNAELILVDWLDYPKASLQFYGLVQS